MNNIDSYIAKIASSIPDLLQGKDFQYTLFKDPLLERQAIREVTKDQVGAYLWIGKKRGVVSKLTEDFGSGGSTLFPGDLHQYVGCAYEDLYTRISHYYHNHRARSSPMIRFLRASGGVARCFLVVFVLLGERAEVETLAQLEYYLMRRLNPDINRNLYSLRPPKDNLGWGVYVYDKRSQKLMYRFRDLVSLVRATNAKQDTIKKHINSETLLLGAFFVRLEPLQDIADSPQCTEKEFILLAQKARADYIAKPGGLYGKDKCKKVYVYNKSKSALLRSFPSKAYMEKTTRITHMLVNKFSKSGALFLNSFVITLEPLPAIPLKSQCSEHAFIKLAKQAREDSRGCKIFARNLEDPTLSLQFTTRILLAKHFGISISTVTLYLKENKIFRDQWEFVYIQKR